MSKPGGLGPELGEFWEVALGNEIVRETSPRLALQLRPSYHLSICQTLGGPGLGAASGVGRGFGESWEAERQRGLDPSVVSACAGNRCKGRLLEVALGKGIVQELRAWHGALARATRVYAGSEDAGSLREGWQIAAGCSASLGEEVGCRVFPRL